MTTAMIKFFVLFSVFFPAALFAGTIELSELDGPAQKCELIVIATPLGSCDTGESITVPHLRPATEIPGVETRFKPIAVLKGSLSMPEFKLHHYRLPKPRDKKHICIVPGLVSFPFNDETFIMFLNKESDGRYAACSGQIDPALSIRPLSDEHWSYDRGYVFTGNRSYVFFMGLSAVLLVLLAMVTLYVGMLLRKLHQPTGLAGKPPLA